MYADDGILDWRVDDRRGERSEEGWGLKGRETS